MSSVYYQHSGRVPLASRLSVAARRQMFNRFMEVMQPTPSMRVLDIGVTSDTRFAESNFFEQWYPYPHQITAVGTEDGAHLETQFPGLRFVAVRPGESIDGLGRFDVVFSNAVIEHVGSRTDQRAFLEQACRLSDRVFVTTPNRWFPFELHTGIPLLHYLPPAVFRGVLRRTSLAYWADEAHLNLLSRADLGALGQCRVEYAGIRIGPWRSNLIAYRA